MTVTLRSRADLTLEGLSRVAFAGEPAEWAGEPLAIGPAAATGSRPTGSAHLRSLPPYVSRAVAFAMLSQPGPVTDAVGTPPLSERELSIWAARDGVATSAALGCIVALLDRRRLEFAERVLALSIEAYRAPLDAYHPALAELWGDPYQAAALGRLDELLADGDPARQRHQGPVSYRIVPRLTGQARRALAQLEDVAAAALRGPAADRTRPDERTFATGLIHDVSIAAAIDAMSATWADIGALVHRHVVRLGRLRGTGDVEPVQAPTDAVDELRRLAQPAVLGALEISIDPREDIPPLAPAAYLSHRRVASLLDEVLAVLAAAIAGTPGIDELVIAPALSGLREIVRGHSPRDRDVWSSNDLARLADAVSDSIEHGRALGT